MGPADPRLGARPADLDDVNHQGESNIHNIGVVQRLFNLGELLAGLYGAAAPAPVGGARGPGPPRALARSAARAAALPRRPVLPAVRLPAIRLVLLPDVGERIVELGEVPELTFYVGLLVMGIVTARGRSARRRSLEA